MAEKCTKCNLKEGSCIPGGSVQQWLQQNNLGHFNALLCLDCFTGIQRQYAMANQNEAGPSDVGGSGVSTGSGVSGGSGVSNVSNQVDSDSSSSILSAISTNARHGQESSPAPFFASGAHIDSSTPPFPEHDPPETDSQSTSSETQTQTPSPVNLPASPNSAEQNDSTSR